uniref:Uncharacterized protein n=1 Tax=Anopheles coluzzii TaxID=1518534 RepID=A0A8W7PWB7_ANOCL
MLARNGLERAGGVWVVGTWCAFVESVINLSVVRPRDVGDRNGFHHGTTYPFADESSGRGSEMASFGFKWQNLAKREVVATTNVYVGPLKPPAIRHHEPPKKYALLFAAALLAARRQLHQAREFESAATEYFNQQRPYLITNQHTL